MHIWFKQNFIQTKDTVNYCVLINKFLELMGDELIQLVYIFEECNNNKSFGYYFKMTIDFRTDIKQTKKTIFTVPHQQRKQSSGYHMNNQKDLQGTTSTKKTLFRVPHQQTNQSSGYHIKEENDLQGTTSTKKTIFRVPHEQSKRPSGYHINKENTLQGTTSAKKTIFMVPLKISGMELRGQTWSL